MIIDMNMIHDSGYESDCFWLKQDKIANYCQQAKNSDYDYDYDDNGETME